MRGTAEALGLSARVDIPGSRVAGKDLTRACACIRSAPVSPSRLQPSLMLRSLGLPAGVRFSQEELSFATEADLSLTQDWRSNVFHSSLTALLSDLGPVQRAV